MGTRFEIAIVADGDGETDAPLRAAGEAALEEIADWHRRLTRFAPDSLVSHLTRTAASQPVQLDLDTFRLFGDALDVWRRSDGAFDITVAPAMAARGFAASAAGASDAGLGADAIVLDAAMLTVRFTAPRALDFGGIGKGHALDRAATVLREHGVRAAFLHGGTSSGVGLGRAPDGLPWRVGIDDSSSHDVVTLEDASFSVSSVASQTGDAGASHLLDPRAPGARPMPVPSAARVLVTGPSARLADAWSTALAVLGHVPPAFPADYTARWV